MRKSLLALATGLLLAGSVSAASAADKLKVGFIYLGPIGDLGWTYQHDQGRLALEKELGDKIEVTYLEKVPEGPDAERAIEQLVRAGNKLIFTTSFGYMDPTLKVAKKYPNVHFEHATGYKRNANMSTYSSKWYQGRYIQGLIAAKMSKSGVLGYIGSFPIPEVVSGINATILAAQTINPNIKVKIIWANTWFDPPKEADAAKALIDQGADVIMQHTDSPAAMQIASERGKLAFGQDSEMIKFGPKTQLTSILDTWGPYYIARVKAELDGTWKSEDTWGGLDSHMFAMAPYTNMPDDVKKIAEDAQAAITAGKLHPFKCPVIGQDGKEIECKGGANLDDGQILGMNFYVKGIDDKLPGK
ncbi:BMP family ABC transporter substrate-binding protein [Bradyrhizobium manausense]|uniref:BMP family ABC transporter substrate-binding protein n=1 Tax=Bradyrhizobium manausense TaxID=989370 RepID=UPI001BACA5F1|nr:BMP family ABC transporter substrate-binding protein [Bradyrhizobium manausense]MBR0689040.1 BMP family ABC transporter substrate-binding protein [Bradyrhizobium manausense]MBR0722471.1 BMP family ABC transporter substrate-binding protein [Bradyrhizobium manausense]MBR0833355.1 BMP family ABC transporter substrate-binding protein [Bradyrhizobium manausense]